MTVLNLENYDRLKEPLFLGKPLGIQSYDIMKYPQFLKMTVGEGGQWEKFWRPEEIELKKDRSDYENMTENEKSIFTSNLKFQTMLDSVICRGVPAFEQYLSNNELEACMITWGFFELIHSYSYTYIIKNVYPEPEKIFNEILTDVEIRERAKSSVQCYDGLYDVKGKSDKKIREQIYLSLVAVNILEAIRFYVSFVCAFAFAENGKMSGNADIIGLIRRDEACVTPDTEVLTPNGWVRFDELQEGMEVAQYNSDGTLEFVLPEKIIKKEFDGELVHIFNDKKHIDMLLTPDHRVIFENLTGQLKEREAQHFKGGNYQRRIPVAGKAIGENSNLSDFERFLIALQADGSIYKPEEWNGKNSGCHRVNFQFTKDRKIERLSQLCDRLGFEYSVSKRDKKNQVSFYIKVPVSYKLFKYLKDWFPYDKSSDWYQEFVEEVVHWDGCVRNKELNSGGSYNYFSVFESNIDVVQAAACLSGYKTYRCSSSKKPKGEGEGEGFFSDVHGLSIVKYRRHHNGQSLKSERVPYKGDVYCVTVPSGMFLARRNNGTFVTGNCHLGISQEILKILHKEPSEGFQQTAKDCHQQAIDMFAQAADEEKQWASYLFKDGSILGLNQEILSKYVEFLTDRRLAALGFDKIYGTKNPMGWLESWMSPSKVQKAPQEIDVTSYKIGSSHDDLGDLQL